jgi:hypothetical protein
MLCLSSRHAIARLLPYRPAAQPGGPQAAYGFSRQHVKSVATAGVGTAFYQNACYNRWTNTTNKIVLYPKAAASPAIWSAAGTGGEVTN